MKVKKKETHGGAREGAGRKKKAETDTITLRNEKLIVDAVKAKYGRKLQGMGKDWMNSLL